MLGHCFRRGLANRQPHHEPQRFGSEPESSDVTSPGGQASAIKLGIGALAGVFAGLFGVGGGM
jgi:uncharacterized membrane protein YfcA